MPIMSGLDGHILYKQWSLGGVYYLDVQDTYFYIECQSVQLWNYETMYQKK